jgi:hypothetical protein
LLSFSRGTLIMTSSFPVRVRTIDDLTVENLMAVAADRGLTLVRGNVFDDENRECCARGAAVLGTDPSPADFSRWCDIHDPLLNFDPDLYAAIRVVEQGFEDIHYYAADTVKPDLMFRLYLTGQELAARCGLPLEPGERFLDDCRRRGVTPPHVLPRPRSPGV